MRSRIPALVALALLAPLPAAGGAVGELPAAYRSPGEVALLVEERLAEAGAAFVGRQDPAAEEALLRAQDLHERGLEAGALDALLRFAAEEAYSSAREAREGDAERDAALRAEADRLAAASRVEHDRFLKNATAAVPAYVTVRGYEYAVLAAVGAAEAEAWLATTEVPAPDAGRNGSVDLLLRSLALGERARLGTDLLAVGRAVDGDAPPVSSTRVRAAEARSLATFDPDAARALEDPIIGEALRRLQGIRDAEGRANDTFALAWLIVVERRAAEVRYAGEPIDANDLPPAGALAGAYDLVLMADAGQRTYLGPPAASAGALMEAVLADEVLRALLPPTAGRDKSVFLGLVAVALAAGLAVALNLRYRGRS